MQRLKTQGNINNVPDSYIKMAFFNNYDTSQYLNLYI